MSFKAQLKVGGTVANILSCSYDLFQETDATGRPSSVTRGGLIEVQIESTGSDEWISWVADSFSRKDGTITFFKRDTDAKLKEVEFKEAYLVKYKEQFEATSALPMTETFTISAKEIVVGNMNLEKAWVAGA